MTMHDDLYQNSAVPVLDEKHGEMGLLTPRGEQARAVTVRVDRSGSLIPNDNEVASGSVRIVAFIKRSDLPSVVVGSDRLAIPTVRGGSVKDRVIEEIMNDAGDEWVVVLK